MSGLPLVPFNFLALPLEQSDLSQARVVVLPVPYDATTSYRTGARDGPRALIDASRYLEEYDPELGLEVCGVGIHTASELEPHAGGPEAMVGRVEEAVGSYLEQGKLMALVGGEHTVSIGSVRAHAQRFSDLSVLYLDAHADLRDEYQGSGFSHACTARRILEGTPVVEVGVRALSQSERSFIEERGVSVFFWEGPQQMAYSPEEVAARLSPNVYISVDLDVFDPSIMSAVGTPEPGGMRWEEVVGLLRTVAERRRVVGFDITELSPGEGPVACAFTGAKLAYKLMGYALCLGER